MEDDYIMCPPAPVVTDMEVRTDADSDAEEERPGVQAALFCQSLLPPCHCLRRWLASVLAG